MPTLDYMDCVLEKDKYKLIFRSDGTVKYLPIEESLAELKKWLKFQWGNTSMIVKMVFNWITRKSFKRGGLEIVGPPDSGKSYFFGALTDMFMAVANIRPHPHYPFNFASCVDKQVIVCEEFYYNPKDFQTNEVIKEATSGQPAYTERKGTEGEVIKATPWMFLLNYENFPADDDADNPWNSRLYRLKTRTYTE